MLNIEKYEEELRPFGTYFAITKDGKIKNCKGFRCGACAFHDVPDSNCNESRFEWLMKEYKEPLITQEDQKILHNIITAYEVFNKGIPSFTKCKAWEKEGGEPKYFIEIHYPGNRVVTPTFNTEVFKGMELNKEYTLKELGL